MFASLCRYLSTSSEPPTLNRLGSVAGGLNSAERKALSETQAEKLQKMDKDE